MTYQVYKTINSILSIFFSRSRTDEKLRKLLDSTPNPAVLFVCTGNICRSPFGEFYLKSISDSSIVIESAGTKAKNGLSANEVAKSSAQTRGINLDSHRTSVLTKELIQKHDIILLMEPMHFFQALKSFPSLGTKKFFLCGLIADKRLSTKLITDPYGRDSSIFEKVFITIESACNNLNNLITNKGNA